MQGHSEFGSAKDKDEEDVEQPVATQGHRERATLYRFGHDYVYGHRGSFFHHDYSFVADVSGMLIKGRQREFIFWHCSGVVVLK